jgi:predicted nucleotidyltransferase
VLTPQLTGIYAGGSWALGDYVVGRSDLDVSVVTARGLADDVVTRLIAESATRRSPVPLGAWSWSSIR